MEFSSDVEHGHAGHSCNIFCSYKQSDGSDGITLFGSEAIQNGAAPAVTVFWLHGLGDTADGWAGAFVPGGGVTLPTPDYKVVLPTAETLPVTLNMGMQMPAWFDIYGLDAGAQVDEAGILQGLQSTLFSSFR